MHRTPAAGFVLFCVFLDALGIGLIIPVLPRLVGVLAGSQELQTVWYGAIMVSYGLMQFCFAPVLGALSDRIGRRPVLLGGIAGLSLMMFVPAFTNSLWLILFSRIAGGMMSSNIVAAQAYIADTTPKEERVSGFGQIGAIFGLAFVAGPALGGVLGDISPRLPFLAAGGICLINFLYGVFVLPESLREPSRAPFTLARLNPFSAILHLASAERLLPYLAILTLFTLAQSVMQCTWALYTEYRYGWTPMAIGLSIFLLGISISVTQGVVLPRLAGRLSPVRLIIVSLTAGMAASVAIALSPIGLLTLPLLFVFSLMGMTGPAVQGIISRRTPADMQGTTMGAVSSLNSFTGAVSPLLGTPLLMITSAYTEHPLLAGAPYLLAAMLALAAALIARRAGG